MTKQHFKMMADIIKARLQHDMSLFHIMDDFEKRSVIKKHMHSAEVFAELAKKVNPGFSNAVFLEACGLTNNGTPIDHLPNFNMPL